MRKWNLSTHIRRKHQGGFDPFHMPAKTVLTDTHYQPRPHNDLDFSKSFLPQINWSDPNEVLRRVAKYDNLLQEINRLSRNELTHLILAIFSLPQFK